MPEIQIIPFDGSQTEAVCALILHIQQVEFQVPITLADQPDLLTIPAVYQQNAGNFWVAQAEKEVIGSIGLIDCGSGIGCIRKMFVKAEWRGKTHSVAQKLLETLVERAVNHGITALYLGTVERLQAAIRFYLKNGFEPVEPDALPPSFPRMAVDTHFFVRFL